VQVLARPVLINRPLLLHLALEVLMGVLMEVLIEVPVEVPVLVQWDLAQTGNKS
jgi:hypothetical protein